MIDKYIDLKKHNYIIKDKPSNISISLFGDIHYSKTFDDQKLEIIASYLEKHNPNYLCITGDIINKGNTWYKDIDKQTKLIKWLELLSTKYKIFLTLGNHDINKKGFNDNNINSRLWLYLSNINNIYISHYNPYYEDEYVIIYQIELSHKYYFNKGNIEDKNWLIDYLKENRNYLTNLSKNKIKIAMCHSPISILDSEVIELLKEYDFIFTGHMHNGMVPLIIDRIINNNIGIISPQKTLFPKVARGVKKITKDDKDIYLIINGGITKLQETSGKLSNLNFLYPMGIDEININTPKANKKLTKIKLPLVEKNKI